MKMLMCLRVEMPQKGECLVSEMKFSRREKVGRGLNSPGNDLRLLQTRRASQLGRPIDRCRGMSPADPRGARLGGK